MIYHHAIAQAVAQSHIADLIAQAKRDGRADRASAARWRLRQRRPPAQTSTVEVAEPATPTADRTSTGKVRRPPAVTTGAESIRVSFE